MYVRFPLSLRNVEDLLFERGIDVCHETIRFWWNKFGPMFASDIRRQRVSAMRGFRHWRWHLDEVFVKINGETRYLWRAVDHEGEILESYVTKTRDKAAALCFMKKALKRHGTAEAITPDGLKSYGAAMRELGIADKQTIGRHANSVTDISRSDAGAKNLQQTSASVSAVIDDARRKNRKAICFVTGVPGSGKTLAGLNLATSRSDEHPDEHAVFLSGNGPLVTVLREALTRDKADRDRVTKATAEREVRSFVQNIHHFRDEYVGNDSIPAEKVVVFDEAQRAWTREQASAFMQRKRAQPDFNHSEPEFLIEVMDRHPDWCAVVCLIGGGQEINTGEAGISEWISALENRFPNWDVYVSPRITLPDYSAGMDVAKFLTSPRVRQNDHLHLAVSMRSFRAEALSDFIGNVVSNELDAARKAYARLENYPIYLTRNLADARTWLRHKARGTERYGLVASSGAQRLRPEGIYVKAAVDPANWFLNAATDVRSSYYLEEVASEFDVQGLELDWSGVCWDGDFYYHGTQWVSQCFRGCKWQSMI